MKIRLILICVSVVILACGSVKVSQSAPPPTATPTATARPTCTPNGEVIGVVIVDGLTVRDAPNEDAASLSYKNLGDYVMGECVYMASGDIWLALDGGKRFVAVLFEGRLFVEGVCDR